MRLLLLSAFFTSVLLAKGSDSDAPPAAISSSADDKQFSDDRSYESLNPVQKNLIKQYSGFLNNLGVNSQSGGWQGVLCNVMKAMNFNIDNNFFGSMLGQMFGVNLQSVCNNNGGNTGNNGGCKPTQDRITDQTEPNGRAVPICGKENENWPTCPARECCCKLGFCVDYNTGDCRRS